MNHFRYIFGTPCYNYQSIPSISNPFSFGIPNMMSQLSSSIPAANENRIFGLGGMNPPYYPLSFARVQIPQTNPTIGGLPLLSSRPNPRPNAPGWSVQPSGKFTSYIMSFIPSSSMLIMKNSFITENPPLSFRVPYRGIHFHIMENPQPRAPMTGGNVYNTHNVASVIMVPIQPFMNQFGSVYYPII